MYTVVRIIYKKRTESYGFLQIQASKQLPAHEVKWRLNRWINSQPGIRRLLEKGRQRKRSHTFCYYIQLLQYNCTHRLWPGSFLRFSYWSSSYSQNTEAAAVLLMYEWNTRANNSTRLEYSSYITVLFITFFCNRFCHCLHLCCRLSAK